MDPVPQSDQPETKSAPGVDAPVDASAGPQVGQTDAAVSPQGPAGELGAQGEAAAPLPAQPAAMRPVEAEDELPEWEELTPELMEDECLRGDFMLRWAVILLGLLLGWVSLTETPLLVNIRSGEYIIGHGGLPPRTDIFSSTAADRSWVNLGWLSDVLLAALHSGMGMASLSLLCALTVFVACWCLAQVGIAGVSTWWSSVCGLLALLGLLPLFQPGQATLSILGLSILLLLLCRWTTHPGCRRLWALPVLFALWTNLDPNCWLGLLLLAVFAVGSMIPSRIGTETASSRTWVIAGAALLAGILLSPWPGQPALGMLATLREMQEVQAYEGTSEFYHRLPFGLLDDRFWLYPDVGVLASLLLVAVSLATVLLNWKRLHWGWTGVWLAANLLSLKFGSVVCSAALVNAAVATLNGQDWYRHTFSMAYSIDWQSVLWGRAGRAATVLGIFFVAYLAINGALTGPQGRRIGMGLDPRWRDRLEDLDASVLQHTYTSHVFPLLPTQGDLLIWLGRKPFIDSRLGLYSQGPVNLAELHRQTRASLFDMKYGAAQQPDSDLWKATFSAATTYDVLVRLWGTAPPYDPVIRLLTSPHWTMTGLGATGANFTRRDLDDPALREHNDRFRATRFSQQAFQPEQKPRTVELSATWPAPVSRYDQWLVQKRVVTPRGAQLASHLDALIGRLASFLTPQQASGLAAMSVRSCREALAQDPNHPLAYRVLVDAYRILEQVEMQAELAAGVQPRSGSYSSQIRAAAFAAVKAGDDEPGDLLKLYQILIADQEFDTAKKILERLDDALLVRPAAQAIRDARKELDALQSQLDEHVGQVEFQVESARAQGAPRPQLVGIALGHQCPSLALALLEEDLTELTRAPDMQLLYIRLLLRTGNLPSAWRQVEDMEELMTRGNPPREMLPLISQWRTLAAEINLDAHDVSRAEQLLSDEQKAALHAAVTSLLQQPFAASNLPQQQDLWAALETRLAVSAEIEIPERWAQLQLEKARAQLLSGHLEQATLSLKSILDRNPEFSQRGVVVYYLTMLTSESFDVSPPSDRIPVWEGMFTPDESGATSPPPAAEPESGKPADPNRSAAPSQPPAAPLPERIQR